MKKILLVGVYLITLHCSYAVTLSYSTASYPKEDYLKVSVDGIDFYLHSNVRIQGRVKTSMAIETYRSCFKRINALLPETLSKFKEKNYKVILLEEKCDGFEVIKFGQSRWDKRHSRFAEGSIIVCKTVAYAEEASYDRYSIFPYLVHEMMHIHHMEILGFNENWRLRNAFNTAKRNPNYKKSDYALHTFSEYWAEVSTAYLLADAYDSHIRPTNSKWLYQNDRLSYDLCVRLLGLSKAGYKSPPKVVVAVNSNPKPTLKPKPEPKSLPPIDPKPFRPVKIDPVTKLEMQESRKKRRGFVEMYSELISKMDDADLEEFSVGAGLGGCVEKSRTFYAEAYNLASDIKFYYPYKQSDSVKKIMDTAWSKLDLE